MRILNELKTFSDYAKQNEQDAVNRRLQELSIQEKLQNPEGQDPAAVKIVNEIQKAAIAAQDPNLDEETRNLAKFRFENLNQIAKSYAIAPGMTPELPQFRPADKPVGFGKSISQALPPEEEWAAAMDEKAQQGVLSPMTGNLPPPMPQARGRAVSEIPGYSDIIAGREGKKEEAKLRKQLEIEPDIAEAVKSSQLKAERVADIEKKSIKAADMKLILGKAEALLPKATGSYIGAGKAIGKRIVGMSDESTQANEELKLLSGWLVSNVPRMEGPQSDFDIMNYKTMAANVGDMTLPIGDRLAALKTLRDLQEKYIRPVNQQKNPARPKEEAIDYTEYFK